MGDAKDAGIIDDIQGRMKTPSVSLAGKINLRQLAFVLKKCSWVLTHDSGVMHLACYFNVPVVALWGPTDINKYAPWGRQNQWLSDAMKNVCDAVTPRVRVRIIACLLLKRKM